LNIVPTQIENYISTSRSTSTISRRAAGIETYERWHGKFWSWAQEATMKTTFAREYENKLLTGVAVNGGISGKSVSRGMIPYAKTYGQYYPTASGTVTTATLNNIIEMLKSNTQSFTTEYACLVGIRAMRDIQENVFTNFLTTAGTNTILGGTLGKGIDFYQWNAQGITLKFIPYPLFDDAELWKGDISAVTGRLKTSSSILCLPMGKVQTTEGQVMPFKKWYLGKQEFIYTYHPGTVGVNGEPLNGAFDQGYQISVNDTDAISCQILTDSCTELVCSDNILYYELTA
jgi:hypothetical protein